MKKLSLFFLFLALGISSASIAQVTDFEAKTFKDDSGSDLKYRLLKPIQYDTSKSYPLILFLHGAGERGSDNFSQLKWGVSHFADPKMREKYPAFVVAPQVPEGDYWSSLSSIRDTTSFTVAMLETPREPMRLTIELLAELQENYAIDSNRLYVTGISMGGFGTFDLIERHPDKFAAAVPICGGGDVARAFLLADMPIWIFHGAKDEVVLPEYSRVMVDAIQIAGGSPGYTEYPDAGHVEAWIQAYDNPLLYEWMFSKKIER